MSDTKDTRELFEVTLDKPHTHEGQLQPKGAKIQVTKPEGEWLTRKKIIKAQGAQAGDK